MIELVARKILGIPFRLDANVRSLAGLLEKYADVPMSLADACLVRMSELREDALVWTLDSHFQLYRRQGRQEQQPAGNNGLCEANEGNNTIAVPITITSP